MSGHESNTNPVAIEIQNEVALVRIDDGKVNALSPELILASQQALDRVEKEARALVLAGRPGAFCAGFDLKVMRQGGAALGGLVRSGAEFALRLYSFPLPVVLAVTGHALAMGAVLCLAADERIGADGEFKLGLNEVAIGMTLPTFAVELARERISKRHLTRAVVNAEIYRPSDAVDAGFLDRVVDARTLLHTARSRARELVTSLDATAHHQTKLRVRADALSRIRASLSEFGPPGSAMA